MARLPRHSERLTDPPNQPTPADDKHAEERKDNRARVDEIDHLDAWGRDPDWHYPRPHRRD